MKRRQQKTVIATKRLNSRHRRCRTGCCSAHPLSGTSRTFRAHSWRCWPTFSAAKRKCDIVATIMVTPRPWRQRSLDDLITSWWGEGSGGVTSYDWNSELGPALLIERGWLLRGCRGPDDEEVVCCSDGWPWGWLDLGRCPTWCWSSFWFSVICDAMTCWDSAVLSRRACSLALLCGKACQMMK